MIIYRHCYNTKNDILNQSCGIHIYGLLPLILVSTVIELIRAEDLGHSCGKLHHQ